MGTSLAGLLDERIARLDAEMVRIKDEAAKATLAAKGQKDVFVKAKLMLAANPDAEALLAQLKTLGVW